MIQSIQINFFISVLSISLRYDKEAMGTIITSLLQVLQFLEQRFLESCLLRQRLLLKICVSEVFSTIMTITEKNLQEKNLFLVPMEYYIFKFTSNV